MLVLARKYRPKKLSDMIGQPAIVQTLTNAIKNNRLHHAYLFTGAYGCGKSSFSRIVAASENCGVSPGLAPCGTCHVCKAVFEGTHIDIQEIDAASNAGKVDQIRKLKSMANYGCIDGAKTKYYIIDECHAMSQDAAEATLKILEEPPVGLRFVLCTTEIQKMRPTIVSRCQVHEVKKIFWRVLADHLENVCKQEKIAYDQDAIVTCAKLSQGSVRNALQNLDKVISYAGSGNQLKSEHANAVFSVASEVIYYDLMDQIIGDGNKPDATKAYKMVQSLVMAGTSFQMICDSIGECLRNILVGCTSKAAADLIYVSEECKGRLKDQLKRCEKKVVSVMESVAKLADARIAVEYGMSPEFALQTWIINSIFLFQK